MKLVTLKTALFLFVTPLLYAENNSTFFPLNAKNISHGVMQVFTQPLFTMNGVNISILKLLISFLLFFLGFFLGGYYKLYIKKITSRHPTISSSTRTILANLGYYTILIVSLFVALNIVGINLSSIALVAGALSVGIGFGLQNIVSNFVSGLILMFEKSVKVGDYVELSETLKGRISDMRMRSTVISTNANIDVIVPNQNFIQNNVINWTMNDDIKRFDIPFGVAYGTQPQTVIDAVLEALQQSGFTDIYENNDRKSRVIMKGLGNSSVDFELLVWIKGEEIFNPRRTTSRFLILIYNTLYANNIAIPFPQLDLHIKDSVSKNNEEI